jgi:hypothetical protein
MRNGKDGGLDGSVTTLDDLFRRAGVRHPDTPALVDPPDREKFTDGAPRALTFSQADRAIASLAARLRGLGLATDTPVAIQLPNTVESIIALLGVLRAGMIAVPLPLLWRQREIGAALGRIGAKAIITCARAGATAQAEIAVQAAAELFSIRFVCGFGNELPDGVVPVDDVFTAGHRGLSPPPRRNGNPAAHVAVVTFDLTVDGLVPVMRNHAELIAAGLAPFRESGMAADAGWLSTVPVSSFAGIALALLPWLLGGGTLSLHGGFDPDTFAAQSRRQNALVLPGTMIAPLAASGHLDGPAETILALWRQPERLAVAAPWQGEATLIDVVAFGEDAVWAARRRPDGMPAPIPSGHLMTPRGGVTAIGGYRFQQNEIDDTVAAVDTSATIVALPDALLGQRFAGSAADRDTVHAELRARGVNPLVAGAFRPRMTTNPA